MNTTKAKLLLLSRIVFVVLAVLAVALFLVQQKHTQEKANTNVSYDELMHSLVTATPPPDGSGSGRVAVIQQGNPKNATPIGSAPIKAAPMILGSYLLFPYNLGSSTYPYAPYLLDRHGTKTVLTQFADYYGFPRGVAAADGTLAITDGQRLLIYSSALSEQASFASTDIANQATEQAFLMPLAFSENSQLLYVVVDFISTGAGGCGGPQGLYEINLTTKQIREIDRAPECPSASSPDRRVIAAVAPAADVAIEDVGSLTYPETQPPSHKIRFVSLLDGKVVHEIRATADTNWEAVRRVSVQGRELALSLAPSSSRPNTPNGFYILNLNNYALEYHAAPDSLVNGWAGSNFVVLLRIADRSIVVYDRTTKEIRPVLTADDINTYQFVGFWE